MEIIGHDTNCQTGEITPIYLTPEFTARLKAIEDDAVTQAAVEAAKAAEKAALLERLGITADEAKLLLG
jgi:hypothetical protein